MARDSLQALSDVWHGLEEFVMRTSEHTEPQAHQLYDLLANPHIRVSTLPLPPLPVRPSGWLVVLWLSSVSAFGARAPDSDLCPR